MEKENKTHSKIEWFIPQSICKYNCATIQGKPTTKIIYGVMQVSYIQLYNINPMANKIMHININF